MSVVIPAVLFVLALFALMGAVAWGALLTASYAARTITAPATRTEASPELAGQHA